MQALVGALALVGERKPPLGEPGASFHVKQLKHSYAATWREKNES